MANCFVVFRAEVNVPDIYELVGNELQLVGRRHHHAAVPAGENPIPVVETLERKLISSPTVQLTIERMDIALGSYHRSVARPVYPDTENLIIPNSETEIELAKSVWREIDLISQDLEQCFNVNSVSERNFDAYGIHYERIIYFCCIGIESLFRKVLVDNGVTRERMTMNDFVALKVHSRLDEVGLSLVRYPWMAEIFPFAEWSSERPSESLPWFGAYNALKHDKKQNEHRATMRNALHAFAGYYAAAYFALGGNLFPGFLSTSYYFHFEARPKWDVRQLYFKPDNGMWRILPLPL
jgi:hypothetical protein